MRSSTNYKRFQIQLLSTALFVVMLPYAFGASCTTQAQMTSAQRVSLANAARAMVTQIRSGDVQGLRANTIPEVAANFSGIMNSAVMLKPLVERATITVDTLYILDASADPPNTPRTEFFCGSPVVVLTFSDLPPGAYALAVLHATGVAKPQQISLILSRASDNHWMLAGLLEKPMTEAGHDGLWYWVSARRFAQEKSDWAAWLYYRQAEFLLNPIDLMTSPNLQKLQHESDAVQHDGLPVTNPMTLNTQGSAFTVTAIDTTTTFGALDLEVHYKPDATQAALLRDPQTARRQVTDIMLALLLQHPDLRNAFHGIWVRADQGANSLFALELPMNGISGSPAPANSVPNAR
ncbi:MAG TPA: hypothetical protein VHX20_19195 [Terracidiphilus sp.]|jgi:hypothetical protein|nr:hypothetical protein [Terracidiphilus sp.]